MTRREITNSYKENFCASRHVPAPFVRDGHHREHWMSDTPSSENTQTTKFTERSHQRSVI